MECPPPQYLVPAHCRNPRRKSTISSNKKNKRHLTSQEQDDIVKILQRIKDKIKVGENKLLRTSELGELKESPHILIDSDGVNIREARFILPGFILYAIPRLLHPKNRHIEIEDRYNKIEQRFTVKYQLMMPIPTIYKYVVLKTCLRAYS